MVLILKDFKMGSSKNISTLRNYSETELISSLTGGDEKSFETIYKRYGAELYRYARRSVPLKEDCEEIVHDIFVSLWVRRQKLGHVTELKPYLYKMVKFKVIRYFQHQAVKKKYAEHFRLFEAGYDTIPLENANLNRIQDTLLKNIESLPERCQMAFRLRVTENLSNTDIAARMDIKKSTVEHYMVTAANHLRHLGKDILNTD